MICFGVYVRKLVCSYVCVCVCVFVAPTGNILGEFLKVVTWLTLLVLDLVLYLYVLVLSTLMSLYGVFSTYWITRGCASGVSAFIVPILVYDDFPFSWCNC